MGFTAVASLGFLSVSQAASRLRARSISSRELTLACLERAAALQAALNALIAPMAERALATAQERDHELARGHDRGPLHGIPIVHKDLIDLAGVPTTAGTKAFAARLPEGNAAVAERLAQAGAVAIGKANMNELAAGTSGRNAHFGDVRNPLDPARSAGGSSSGSAAALAAGFALGATGSDTGGSIRIPAACCGLVGLRPTFGTLSLEGVTLRSNSFDTVGPMARSVEDCRLLYAAMAGRSFQRTPGLRNAKIGVLRWAELHEDIARAFEDAIRTAGPHARSMRIPELGAPALLDELMDVMLFEFKNLLPDARRASFGPVVAENLRRAQAVTPERYRTCLERARRAAHATHTAMERFDALLVPTLVDRVPLLDAPAAEYDRQRILTLPLSATGLPILALPCGKDSNGMPVGMQLVGRAGGEEQLLALAARLEDDRRA